MEMSHTPLLSSDARNNRTEHLHPRATLRTLASLIIVMLASSSASAASLNVVGGQLMGASGVDVGGSFYDVEFLDGTCIALFDGCAEAADFAFPTSGQALAAALAVLDQVMLDSDDGQFDNEPALTNGCVELSGCAILIPFGIANGTVSVRSAVNGLADLDSTSAVGTLADNEDSFLAPSSVYAVFTPVPEPGTGLLIGLGLLGLSHSKVHRSSRA